jgi:type III secretion protein R
MNPLDPLSGLYAVAAFSLLPFAAVMMTSFAKIVIIFGLLKNALGLPQIPPAVVTNGLALILSLFIMAPVAEKMSGVFLNSAATNRTAAQTFEMFSAAKEPLRDFMKKHTTPNQREFFVGAATSLWPPEMSKDVKDDNLLVLIPTFSISEINKAFKVGFALYLVFVVIDVVVANILLALGMSMMQPTMISAPIKLLLFIAVDGMTRLTQYLVLSYQ